MICNNTIISDRNNQAFSLSIQDIIYVLGGVTAATYVAPDGLEKLANSQVNLIKEISRRFIFYDRLFPRQATLAKSLGCSRRTIQYAQKDLLEIGFINVVSGKQAHESNEYTLSNFILDERLIFPLRHVLPSLRFIIRKFKGLPAFHEICNSVKGSFGVKSVENQNCARINNVLKDSYTNTSLYIDTSKKGEIVPKNKIEEWLEPKVFEIVKHLMRIDVFMSEKTARYIAKYGEMSRIAREKWENARAYIPTLAEKTEKIRLQEIQDAKDKIIFQKAALTATGLQAEFLKYKL